MRFFLLLASMALLACSSPQATPTPEVTHDYLLMSALYVQHSAEYKALCWQTYGWAKRALADQLTEAPVNPAIVLDLDETVLDNSPYSGWQVVNNQPYAKESWMQWTTLADADTVPGVSGFLHWVDRAGVKIFYVSNRRVAELDATLTNLNKLGLPQADSQSVLLRDTTSSKVPRRNTITEQGYSIVMLCGDNLNDFAADFEEGNGRQRKEAAYAHQAKWGTTWIVLPNPTYGAWDGALFDFNYELSLAQRDSIRKSRLRSF